jgi:hypothetical protein
MMPQDNLVRSYTDGSMKQTQIEDAWVDVHVCMNVLCPPRSFDEPFVHVDPAVRYARGVLEFTALHLSNWIPNDRMRDLHQKLKRETELAVARIGGKRMKDDPQLDLSTLFAEGWIMASAPLVVLADLEEKWKDFSDRVKIVSCRQVKNLEPMATYVAQLETIKEIDSESQSDQASA